jgi:hypothetical protein
MIAEYLMSILVAARKLEMSGSVLKKYFENVMEKFNGFRKCKSKS